MPFHILKSPPYECGGAHLRGAPRPPPPLFFSPLPSDPPPPFSLVRDHQRAAAAAAAAEAETRPLKKLDWKKRREKKGGDAAQLYVILRTPPPPPLCRKPSLSTVHFCFLPPSLPGAAAKRYSLTPPLCLSAVQLGMGSLWVLGRGQRSRMRLLKHNNGTDGRTDGNPLLPLHSSCRERRGAFIPSSSSLLRV